ncbi:MAG: C_GCAxxG_C_C family protein [Bacteroidales bacterium]|nr:C_GCAxxG_C_C family protein [Bacteroidales bacterium]
MTEDRVEKAVALFHEGYNCAQSVVAAYADLYGIDTETALKMSASFGGGMGRMRQVCGAVSGMFMVNGLDNGQTDPSDKEAKQRNYAKVQELAAAFRSENGSILCGELLAGTCRKVSDDPQPSERTPEYYRKRPCAEYVRCCAQLIESHIRKQD